MKKKMEFSQFVAKNTLPNESENEIITEEDQEEICIRSNVRNEDEIKDWVANFGKNSNTKWISSETHPEGKKFICKRTYVCQHSSKNKAPIIENSNKNKKGLSRNTNCLAKITLKVELSTRNTRKKDEYVRRGLPCVIHIRSCHNHPLISHDVLEYLPSDDEMKEKFLCYFESGLGVSESRKHHYELMESMGSPQEDFANNRINPTYRTVSYWYDNWRKEKYGSKFNKDIFETLNKKRDMYAEKNVIISYGENPFHIFVATPLMQRAHTIPAARNTLFIDTTSTCDAANHAITFLLTACSAGAVPLGILITADQTTESFIAGFTALKNSIPKSFNDQGHPNIVMTDNCTAEINAVRSVWPDAVHYLCIFHVLQYIWRWLSDTSHKIPENLQRSFFTTFQRILYTMDQNEAENAFESAVAVGQNFPTWTNYLNNQWAIKDKWCLAYRVGIVEHHTNNYAEISVRIFKDNVLNRVKAYNVAVLIEFITTTLENFYKQKLREFADGRNIKPRLLLDSLLKRCSYLNKNDIKQINESEYKVLSETQPHVEYTVSVHNSISVCECEFGKRGQLCKHVMGIYKFFNVIFQKLPPVSMHDKKLMAYVALGDKAPNLDFFIPLHVRGLPKNDLEDITKYFEQKGSDEQNGNDVNVYTSQSNDSNRDEVQNNVNKTPNPEPNIDDNSDMDDYSDVEINTTDLPVKFVQILKQLCVCHNENGNRSSTSTTTEDEGMDKFLKRLKKIRSSGQWATFLHTAANNVSLKQSSRSKIRVQPTSIQRRRAGLPRGNTHLPPGRPASTSTKKKHSLNQKFFFNNSKRNKSSEK